MGGRIHVARAANGTMFNDNIYVESSGDGVYFSSNGGSSKLAEGKTVSIGPNGFKDGGLKFWNFEQLGDTPQNLILSHNSTLKFESGSIWNGHMNVISPDMYFEESTFNSGGDFTKNAGGQNVCLGGNLFNGTTTFTQTKGELVLGAEKPDIFYSDVTFVNLGSEHEMHISRDAVGTEFHGDLTINSPIRQILFNSDGGSIVMKGGLSQSITILGPTVMPEFHYLTVDKNAGEVILNTPVFITDTLEMVDGNIVSSTTNPITLTDDASAISASNNSFVDGPVMKIGDDEFTFPTGGAGEYMPISISAPTNVLDEFIAEYIPSSIHPTYDSTFHAGSIYSLITDQYWTLHKSDGSSAIEVSLSWNECNGSNLEDLLVSNWNGSQWLNLGNQSTIGDKDSGMVLSSVSVSDLGPFVLGFSSKPLSCLNQAPEFTSTSENSMSYGNLYTYEITTTDFEMDDLTISANSIPEWTVLTDNGDGTAVLQGTPDCSSRGPHQIDLVVSDGGLESVQSYNLTVEGTDDTAPIIIDMPEDIIVNTDFASNTAIVSWAIPSAIDDCSLQSLTSDYGSGQQFDIGETVVTYIAMDSAGNESNAEFTITVIDATNDAPSFTAGMDQEVNEDAGYQSVVWASNISAGANESQALTFEVSNDNAGLFGAQPAIDEHGALTYESAADAYGSAVVSVALKDDGGVENGGVDTSDEQTFTITVNPINDAPSFIAGANQEVNEDAGYQSVAWASNISSGTNEIQQLTFEVSNDNAGLFSAQPAISENGTLTYESAADAYGSAVVSVALKDDGGVDNGGIDSSSTITFDIRILEADGGNEVPDVNPSGNNEPPVYIPNIFSTKAKNEANRSIRVYSEDVDSIREFMFEVYELTGDLVYRSQNWQEANQIGWNGENVNLSTSKRYFIYKIGAFLQDGRPYNDSGTIVMIQ